MRRFQDVDPAAPDYSPYASYLHQEYYEFIDDCPDNCEDGQVEVLKPGEPPDGFTEWAACDTCGGEGKIKRVLHLDPDTAEVTGEYTERL